MHHVADKRPGDTHHQQSCSYVYYVSCADWCVFNFNFNPSLSVENSSPGSELEVSLDGTSLEISCNPCLENFFKADESPE